MWGDGVQVIVWGKERLRKGCEGEGQRERKKGGEQCERGVCVGGRNGRGFKRNVWGKDRRGGRVSAKGMNTGKTEEGWGGDALGICEGRREGREGYLERKCERGRKGKGRRRVA